MSQKTAWAFLWSQQSHCFSISLTRDLHEWFSHCQLLYSPLSSSAFLNMHALHFPTTFQIQMDVPCSPLLFSSSSSPLLPLLSATPLYLWLTQFSGLIHPAVLRQTVERQTDWQIDTKAHQQAGMDASTVPITVPTHPFARMNPSLSAYLCQTQLRFFVFTAPDTHTYIHYTPPAPPQHHLLFGLRRELEAHPLSHWFALTGWAAGHPQQLDIFRSL